MDFPHGVMVTVRSTTTTTNSHGDSTTVVVESQWGPCAVAPRSSEERTDSRAPAVITGLTVYGPQIDLDADDTLLIDGETYQVEGNPGEWRSPFTDWAPGLEVAVKKVG